MSAVRTVVAKGLKKTIRVCSERPPEVCPLQLALPLIVARFLQNTITRTRGVAKFAVPVVFRRDRWFRTLSLDSAIQWTSDLVTTVMITSCCVVKSLRHRYRSRAVCQFPLKEQMADVDSGGVTKYRPKIAVAAHESCCLPTRQSAPCLANTTPKGKMPSCSQSTAKAEPCSASP